MTQFPKKIRLLYFHPTAVFGGAERTTAILLERLDKSLFEVLFVTKKGTFPTVPVDRILYIDDLGVHDGFSGILHLLKDARVLLQVIQKEKPDIVFGMLHYACIMLSFVKIFMRQKVKIIASPRTPSGDAINFYFRQSRRERVLWKGMIRFFCRHSDHIIVASEGIRQECISEYKAEKKKVVTIPNSVDVKSVERLSEEPLDKASSPGSLIISTAGRLSAEKNISVLLKAFALLKKDCKVKLWIIGEGPERPRLESLAASLDIIGDIVFWGFQENPYKFISKSDVFVHTSLFEGFGNIILEAMACRVPVIATDCPFGPGEIIKHGESGILVPVSNERALAEALKNILGNSEMRMSFIESACRELSSYTPERMVKRYEDVFLNVAGAEKLESNAGREGPPVRQ